MGLITFWNITSILSKYQEVTLTVFTYVINLLWFFKSFSSNRGSSKVTKNVLRTLYSSDIIISIIWIISSPIKSRMCVNVEPWFASQVCQRAGNRGVRRRLPSTTSVTAAARIARATQPIIMGLFNLEVMEVLQRIRMFDRIWWKDLLKSSYSSG